MSKIKHSKVMTEAGFKIVRRERDIEDDARVFVDWQNKYGHCVVLRDDENITPAELVELVVDEERNRIMKTAKIDWSKCHVKD